MKIDLTDGDLDFDRPVGRCAACGAVLTGQPGGDPNWIDCPECVRLFCDSCYNCEAGDGCHCHPALKED